MWASLPQIGSHHSSLLILCLTSNQEMKWRVVPGTGSLSFLWFQYKCYSIADQTLRTSWAAGPSRRSNGGNQWLQCCIGQSWTRKFWILCVWLGGVGWGVSGPWASPGIHRMKCTSKVTTGIWEVRESKTVNKGSTDFDGLSSQDPQGACKPNLSLILWSCFVWSLYSSWGQRDI